MNKEQCLIIGSGQTGTRLGYYFSSKYGFTNSLYINTAEDNKIENQFILKDKFGNEFGSGRNPLYTLETILPKYHEEIESELSHKLDNSMIDTIIMFNSIGGGSGSAINYYIVKEILSKKYPEISCYLIPIYGFKHEGNPIVSNGIAMTNLYTNIYDKCTILPIENDMVHEDGKTSTFEITNDNISQIAYKIIDYDYFLGIPKSNGIGMLDKNEHKRMTSPVGGFLSYAEINLNTFSIKDDFFNSFDISTATHGIVLFKTKKNNVVKIEQLKAIDRLFPNTIKIIAESETDKDECVELILNGVSLPKEFDDIAEDNLNKLSTMKQMKKDIKKDNKSRTRIAKRSLFNI